MPLLPPVPLLLPLLLGVVLVLLLPPLPLLLPRAGGELAGGW